MLLGRGIVRAFVFFGPLRRRGTGPAGVPRSLVVFAIIPVRLYRTTATAECTPLDEVRPLSWRLALELMRRWLRFSAFVLRLLSLRQLLSTLDLATLLAFVRINEREAQARCAGDPRLRKSRHAMLAWCCCPFFGSLRLRRCNTTFCQRRPNRFRRFASCVVRVMLFCAFATVLQCRRTLLLSVSFNAAD